jgi:hypothetical protein
MTKIIISLTVMTSAFLYLFSKNFHHEISNDSLIVASSIMPDNLNPYSVMPYYKYRIVRQIFDTLLSLDEKLEPQPQIAERWDLNDDIFIFYINKKYFHNGSIINVFDVKKSLIAGLKSNPENMLSIYNADKALLGLVTYDSLINIDPDKGLISIRHAKGKRDLLLRSLSLSYSSISKDGEGIIGSGPYVLEKKIDHEIQLRKNINDTIERKKYSKLIFKYISEERVLEVFNKDQVNEIDSLDYQSIRAPNKGEFSSKVFFPGVRMLAISPKFKDLKIRDKRISLINKVMLIVEKSQVYPTLNMNEGLIPKGLKGYKIISIPETSTELEGLYIIGIQRKEEVDIFNKISKSLYKSKKFEIQFKFFADILKIKKSTQKGEIAGRIFGDVAKLYDASSIFNSFHSSFQGNTIGLKDNELDRLILRTLSTESAEENLTNYQNINTFLIHHGYVLPFYHLSIFKLFNKRCGTPGCQPLLQPWSYQYVF